MKAIKRLFFAVVAILCLTMPISTFALPVGSSPPALSAKSAILINGESGAVYYGKNEDQRLGMASTTKLMTAIVALELADADSVVRIPRAAVGIEGSSVYLIEGERLTLSELIYALLLSSANDAAVAIAIHTAGSVDAFVEKMNEKAADMGLDDTHFTNPHGLYDEAHYTTARELAIIAAEALKFPFIAAAVGAKKASISHDGKAGARLLVNHNKLLRCYEGAIGMKTGFTKKTGRCLVSAAERDGLTLIAVTLDAPDDWSDHTALLDYGFASYEKVCLYGAGEFSYSMPLSDGKPSSITLTNSQPLTATVAKGVHSRSVTVLSSRRFLIGEVSEGECIGTVTVSAGGSTVSSPLIASESSIGRTKPQKGFSELLRAIFPH